MENISAMDMFLSFRKAIKEMIEKDPDATAKDVLDALELTQDLVELLVKRIKK